MTDQKVLWRTVASRLGVKVTAPAMVMVGDQRITFTALLPQFGGKSGMIVDPDWAVINPHRAALLKLGFGYSAVTLGSDNEDIAQQMLRDCGWSAAEPKPPWMAAAPREQEVWEAQLHVRPLPGKGEVLNGAKGAYAWVFALANSDVEYRERVSVEMEALGLFIAEMDHLGRHDATEGANDPSSQCINGLTDECPVQYHHFHTYADDD